MRTAEISLSERVRSQYICVQGRDKFSAAVCAFKDFYADSNEKNDRDLTYACKKCRDNEQDPYRCGQRDERSDGDKSCSAEENQGAGYGGDSYLFLGAGSVANEGKHIFFCLFKVLRFIQPFSGKQFVDVDPEYGAERKHQTNLGKTVPRLPFGDSFLRYIQLLGYFALRISFFFSCGLDKLSDLDLIHKRPPYVLRIANSSRKNNPRSVGFFASCIERYESYGRKYGVFTRLHVFGFVKGSLLLTSFSFERMKASAEVRDSLILKNIIAPSKLINWNYVKVYFIS